MLSDTHCVHGHMCIFSEEMVDRFNQILKRFHKPKKLKTKTNKKHQEMSRPTGLDVTCSSQNTLMNPDIISYLRNINYLTVFADVSQFWND